MTAAYLILVVGVIIAQIDRSIDELSFSRSYLIGQSLAKLLTQSAEFPTNTTDNLELTSKVERTLLSNPEISVILIRRPDGVTITKTGSKDIINAIDSNWDRRALRHFALQGSNHPFVARVHGVEFCAIAAQNSDDRTIAIVWMVRQREMAKKALEAAFNAVYHMALIFVFPCFLFVSLSFWFGIKWYFQDIQNSENPINKDKTGSISEQK